MIKYAGTKCIVCDEKFKDGDDVVVCPQCGTPYHRACYKKEGKCINTSLHENGGAWRPEYEPVADVIEKSDRICKKCGFENPEGTMYCEICGSSLQELEKHNERMRIHISAVNENGEPIGNDRDVNGGLGVDIQPFLINFSDPLCGYNPLEEYEDVKLYQLADYVDTNTHYYLPIFKRIKETGRSFSWNFPAMLFPELYFANRRMPLAAFLAWAAQLLTMLPVIIVVLLDSGVPALEQFASSFDLRSSAFQAVRFLTYALDYGIMFFCGAFANKIYYRSAIRKTAAICRNTPVEKLKETLKRKGGTSIVWLILFILLKLLPFFAVYALNFMSIFEKMI